MQRHGIIAGGNFIIDHVKLINAWPSQEMLVDIVGETLSNGGGPYNVLKDLSAMRVGYPLEAVGLVGMDEHGSWIKRDCENAGIGIKQLQQTAIAPTSYTYAMTVKETGKRTFFHQRGANALLGERHFNFAETSAAHFHLGYLMLLDEMDRLESDGRSVASKVLEKAKHAGLSTSVDIVSIDTPNFRQIAESSLPYTDYLIFNEIEAGKVAGLELRNDRGIDLDSCAEAAKALLARGVQKQVVIHFVEGAITVDSNGKVTHQASLNLPAGFIVGATGAGDAFAAGYLHGIHEQWTVETCLQLAVCSAAACLSDATPSLGLRSVTECFQLGEKFRA